MPELAWAGTGVLLPDGSILVNVHRDSDCAGRACVIHNPTDHHMRDWHLLWRDDRGIFERICEHGCGHPDPDQMLYWLERGEDYAYGMSVHGCCGCCRPPEAIA